MSDTRDHRACCGEHAEGMRAVRCPECHKDDDRVCDSRAAFDRVRRVRLCRSCGHRWATVEVSTAQQADHERLKREATVALQRATVALNRAVAIIDGEAP